MPYPTPTLFTKWYWMRQIDRGIILQYLLPLLHWLEPIAPRHNLKCMPHKTRYPNCCPPFSHWTATSLRCRRRWSSLSENLIQKHRSLISTIRRSPAEMLGEVFAHCLPERCTLRVNKTPSFLTRACHHWRHINIAISMRELWSSFTHQSHCPFDVVTS